LQQELVPLPLDEQIERRQNRQPGLHQRQELLVEDQECRLFQLAAPHRHARRR